MFAARALAVHGASVAGSKQAVRQMSVRIRLARFGRKHRPFYRIRVADSRSKRDGKFLENVGTYDPLPSKKDNMKQVRLDRERIEYWLSVGAQPSDTVKRILGHAGILPEFVHPLSVETAIPRKDRPKKERKKKKKKK